MADNHDKIVQLLRKVYPDEFVANVPSRLTGEIGLRFQRYDEKKMLGAILPASDRFSNPMGGYQSGAIGAALDAVFTAFGTLVAGRPCSVITSEVTNLRPIAADGKAFKVEARLRALRSSTVFLEGRAEDWEGNSVAIASATLAVYRSSKKGK